MRGISWLAENRLAFQEGIIIIIIIIIIMYRKAGQFGCRTVHLYACRVIHKHICGHFPNCDVMNALSIHKQ
jgi:hypothetical protein